MVNNIVDQKICKARYGFIDAMLYFYSLSYKDMVYHDQSIDMLVANYFTYVNEIEP